MKNIFISWYVRIVVFSAISAITLQNIILKWVLDISFDKSSFIGNSNFIIMILSTSFTYYFIYRTLIFFYERWGWKKLLSKYNISGLWFHEFFTQSEPSYIRRGHTEIIQNALGFQFTAQNYDSNYDIATLTNWNSVMTSLEDNSTLTIAYHAQRSRQPSSDPFMEKEGIMSLHINYDKNKNPISIAGPFRDTYPSLRLGTITLSRNPTWKSEYCQHILNNNREIS